jgi:hypothetical protein
MHDLYVKDYFQARDSPFQSTSFILLYTIPDTYVPHCRQTYFQGLLEDKKNHSGTHGIYHRMQTTAWEIPFSVPPHFLAYSCITLALHYDKS